MKQIIGYIEYDYMNIKYGMWYLVIVFTLASLLFSVRSGTGAVGYMLFGGLILAGTAFASAKQTVSFTALVPGNILQKVLGRYLGGVLCIVTCAVFGVISANVVKIAGYDNGAMELSVLAGMLGITLLFLALQNIMLYLLMPVLGVQFAGLVRMVPGFCLFFLVMNAGKLETVSNVLQYGDIFGGIILGIGAASLVPAVFLSCLIIRNRDNE